jgi:cytoskeleton protein RodZ
VAEHNQQESLGSYLRQAREGKGVSIEQVAYATRISLKMLAALEDDDHSALPAPTFVRGYLQAYAKYVRIDSQDLLLRYQHHLAIAPDTKKASIHSHYLYVNERYQEKKRLVLILVLFVAMLGVAGTYFLLKAKREKNKRLAQQAELIQKADPTKPEEKVAPAVVVAETPVKQEKTEKPAEKSPLTQPTPPAKTTAAEPHAQNQPVPTTQPSENTDAKRKYNLTMRAEQDVWFRFQTDGEEVRDLTLRTGKSLTLRANTVIKIFSGNLGSLKATLNGKELPSLATPDRSMSAVLPDTEVKNYPLPLFPQFQKKPESNPTAPNAAAPQ